MAITNRVQAFWHDLRKTRGNAKARTDRLTTELLECGGELMQPRRAIVGDRIVEHPGDDYTITVHGITAIGKTLDAAIENWLVTAEFDPRLGRGRRNGFANIGFV